MPYLSQNVGIDVAKDSFVAYFEVLYTDLRQAKRLGQRTFPNTPAGHQQFTTWVKARILAPGEVPLQFILEATGRYHEALAYHLAYHLAAQQLGRLSILLPNKLKHFARGLNLYSKTDPIDAQLLARYAGLHTPRAWKPANASMRRLRELTRERQDLVQMRVRANNRLHAQQSGAHPERRTMRRLKRQIALFDAPDRPGHRRHPDVAG